MTAVSLYRGTRWESKELCANNGGNNHVRLMQNKFRQ